jgi:hypothetical protein
VERDEAMVLRREILYLHRRVFPDLHEAGQAEERLAVSHDVHLVVPRVPGMDLALHSGGEDEHMPLIEGLLYPAEVGTRHPLARNALHDAEEGEHPPLVHNKLQSDRVAEEARLTEVVRRIAAMGETVLLEIVVTTLDQVPPASCTR